MLHSYLLQCNHFPLNVVVKNKQTFVVSQFVWVRGFGTTQLGCYQDVS